jgi:hypothetical protein
MSHILYENIGSGWTQIYSGSYGNSVALSGDGKYFDFG